jgi:hypothetical protein
MQQVSRSSIGNKLAISAYKPVILKKKLMNPFTFLTTSWTSSRFLALHKIQGQNLGDLI